MVNEAFMPDELSILTDHFRHLRIGGNIDVDPISECPSTGTRHLSALLNSDGFFVSDAAPVHANSFQLNYLSAFDKEPITFFTGMLLRLTFRIRVENCLNELKLWLMQRRKEPDPTSIRNYSPNA